MIFILCCIPSLFPFPQSSLLFPMGCLLIWQISHFNCRHLFTITVIIIITVMLPIIKSVITTSRDLGQYVNRWWLLGPNARSGSGSSYKFNTQLMTHVHAHTHARTHTQPHTSMYTTRAIGNLQFIIWTSYEFKQLMRMLVAWHYRAIQTGGPKILWDLKHPEEGVHINSSHTLWPLRGCLWQDII